MPTACRQAVGTTASTTHTIQVELWNRVGLRPCGDFSARTAPRDAAPPDTRGFAQANALRTRSQFFLRRTRPPGASTVMVKLERIPVPRSPASPGKNSLA